MGRVTSEPIQIFPIFGKEKKVQILPVVAIENKHGGTKTFLIEMYVTRCIFLN